MVHPLWVGVVHPRWCGGDLPLMWIITHDGGELPDGRHVLLFVGGGRWDEPAEGREEIRGGGDSFVMFAHGRDRPMGRVEAVRAGDSVASRGGHIELQELVVMRGAAYRVRFVTVGRERITCVWRNVHHAFVAKWRHGRPVPIKLTLYFFVRSEPVIIPRRAQHVEGVLDLRQHLAP